MAEKDWKKLTDDGRKLSFSKDEGITGLLIYPDSKMIDGIYTDYQWVVLKNTGKRNFFKNFKSKSDALDYAKSYMRLH